LERQIEWQHNGRTVRESNGASSCDSAELVSVDTKYECATGGNHH
jgi:hypothetical protein